MAPRPVELIYHFIRQSELMPRESFVDSIAGPVLLYKRWAISKPFVDSTKTMNDARSIGELSSLLEEQKKQLVTEAHDYRVYRLPLADGQWTLGRGAVNDLVFAHRSVSKDHARISIGADQSLMAVDLGSKNGTWIEEKRAMPDKPIALWSKQSLRLGTLPMRFLSAADFYDLLGSLLTAKAV